MGEYEQYTVEELSEMVAGDRPGAIRAQADGWATLASVLTRYSNRLNEHRDRMADNWTGQTAGAYSSAVAFKSTELETASSVASGNARSWHRIADAVEEAQTGIARLNQDWQTERQAAPAQEHDALREPFDTAARRLMDQVTLDIDGERGSITDHAPLTSVSGFPTDGLTAIPDDVADNAEPDGADTDTGEDPPPNTDAPADPPPPTDDPRGPELQSGPYTVSGPLPNTSVIPHCPPPKLLPVPPPIPVPAIPPTHATPPPPPGPRTTRTTTQQLTPRTTNTVRPVIGARPGTTGMAPTTPTRTPDPITRPVIGARATTRTGPAATPDHRVTTTPQLSAPAARKRKERPDDQHGPSTVEEDFWTPPATLPAVIHGSPSTESTHDPGPTLHKRPEPSDAFADFQRLTSPSAPIEQDVIRRLATPPRTPSHTELSHGLTGPDTCARGVITNGGTGNVRR